MPTCVILSCICTGFSHRGKGKHGLEAGRDFGKSAVGPQRPRRALRRGWIRLRNRLKKQSWFSGLVVNSVLAFLKFVNRTNPLDPRSSKYDEVFRANEPAIVALWHGQHLMIPFLASKGAKFVAMISRSGDAEVNARIVERMGFQTVRGSGGRNEPNEGGKGGAKALIGLKKALDRGRSAVMIADISKGTARQAGNGIILLARLSGRPILAVAYATSRRHVIRRSWDKTTVNLPFGRAAAIISQPLYVEKNADDARMEEYRAELTRRLDAATKEAYAIVDGRA